MKSLLAELNMRYFNSANGFVKYIPYISIHSILKPPPRIENENSIGFCFTVGFDTCNYSGITNNNLL